MIENLLVCIHVNLYAMPLLTMENVEGVLCSCVQKGNIDED